MIHTTMIQTIEKYNGYTFQYIFHLSDIHIRLYARHHEYRLVFDCVYTFLRSHHHKTGVIVITGDILHSKVDLTPECCLLTLEFLSTLSSIMPTVIIAGNHDALLHNRDRTDSLTAILQDRMPEQLHYLQWTGWTRMGNLVFLVNSLLDDDPWISPASLDRTDENTIVIALYHGMVGSWKNVHGFVHNASMSDRSLTDFDGADWVLLGDIHKHQYLTDDAHTPKRIAYAGSLISQNFSETDNEHGILVWNLVEKTSYLHIIDNNYAFRSLRICDVTHVESSIDNKLYTVTEIDLPSNGSVQVHGTGDPTIDRAVCSQLRYRFPHIRLQTLHSTMDTISIGSSQTNQTLPMYDMESFIVEFVTEMTSSVRIPSTIDRSALSATIVKYYVEHTPKRMEYTDWELVSICFDHMFGYGAGQEIRFDTLPRHSVTGIFGNNSAGKSSLIDIIIFALYGKITRSTTGNTIPKDLIHIKEKKASVTARLRIGSDYFTIVKQCTRLKNDKIKIQEKLYCRSAESHQESELTDEQRCRTQRFITEKIGHYDNFLFTNVMLQQREKSFRDMTQSMRKDFLYHLFHVDIFEEFCKDQQDALKVMTVQRADLEKRLVSSQSRLSASGSTMTEQEWLDRFDVLDTTLKTYENTLLTLEKQKDDLLTQLVPLDPQVYDTIEDQMMTCQREMDSLEMRIESIHNEYEQTQKDLLTNCPCDPETLDRDILSLETRLRAFENTTSMTAFPVGVTEEDTAIIQAWAPQYQKDMSMATWTTEFERVTNMVHTFSRVEQEWKVKKEQYNHERDSLLSQRPPPPPSSSMTSCCLPLNCQTTLEQQWIQFQATRADRLAKKERIQRTITKLKQELEKYPLEWLDSLDEWIQQIILLISETHVKESMYRMHEAYQDENATIEYNSACPQCMQNPHYVEQQERTLHWQDARDAWRDARDRVITSIVENMDLWCDRFSQFPRWTSSFSVSEEQLPEEVYVNTKVRPFMQSLRQNFQSNTQRLTNYRHDIETIEEEERMAAYVDRMYQQRRIDTSLDQLQKQMEEDPIYKKYMEVTWMVQHYPTYVQLQTMWSSINDGDHHTLRRRYDELIHYRSMLHEREETRCQLQGSLQQCQNRLIDWKVKLVTLQSIRKSVIENQVCMNSIDHVRQEIDDTKQNLESARHEQQTSQQRYQEWTFIIATISEIQTSLCALDTQIMFTNTLLPLIDRDGLPLYLLGKQLLVMEEDMNQLVAPFLTSERRIAFHVREKELVFGMRHNDAKSENVSSFYGGMEAFIVDIALKLTFSRYGRIPRSNFFIIDEGVSVLDQDRLGSISALFSFLCTCVPHVLVMSHLPPIKDFVDNRIEIQKDADTQKSHLVRDLTTMSKT